MTPLWLAYLALGGGLMILGAVLIGLSLRRPPRPVATPVKLAMLLAALGAAAGVAAAVILEARAARPW